MTYGEITRDAAFWDQCKACVNYDILMSKGRKICLCTAMMFEPARCVNEEKIFNLKK